MEIERIHDNGGVEVLKASAGSGKTYSLAREYIRLLLEPDKESGVRDRYKFRHILAVTFTNKATGEMKARIIKELDILSHDADRSDYKDYLMQNCGFSTKVQMQEACCSALSAILNDYGSFSISTIDRFFQSSLRSFSREIGQFNEYQIELDRESLIAEASDRVLDSIDESSPALLKWLSKASIEQIQDGYGYHLDNTMKEFAQGYMSDAYSNKIKEYGIDEDSAFAEENLQKMKKTCQRIVREFDSKLEICAAKALADLEAIEGVKVNLKKNISKFLKLNHGAFIEPAGIATLEATSTDGSAGLNAKALKNDGAGAIAQVELIAKSVMDCLGEELKTRNTAFMLEGQVYVFRMAESLKRSFEELLKEKNVLSIDDTNAILNDIIAGTEIPFIYEKTGVKYQHFLLDEFQDTSRIQWENFMPLLKNSISEACYNLIVGDVKQSIYRWRNTDWKILDEEVSSTLDPVLEHPLEYNWRSAEKIIEFNNCFYSELAFRMDSQLDRKLPDGSVDNRIQRLFSDVRQIPGGKIGVPGCVEATFCEPEEIIYEVIDSVEEAISRGFSLRDIAVIVRSNSQGSVISHALMDANINVVTNDSLKISSGESVRTLVARMYLYNRPDDAIHGFYAGDFDPSAIGHTNSLTDLAEEILSGMELNDDSVYVLAFMDLLRDFVSKNGNSLDAFLKYWEESGIRMNVSSTEDSDAVTVITIHKVKGLDFPYVILPFQAKNTFMKGQAKYWEMPQTAGTELETLGNALYHVSLSAKSSNTLFYDRYLKEQQMAFIDNANLWYVAMTRASQAMHLIAPSPSGKQPDGWSEFSQISDALYMFINSRKNLFKLDKVKLEEECIEHYIMGEIRPKWEKKNNSEDQHPECIPLVFKSYRKKSSGGRLRISSDARDFFSKDGNTGISASNRLKGTVLHQILENVRREDDLKQALSQSMASGAMDHEQGKEAESLLCKALAAVRGFGWFSNQAQELRCERGIIEPNGNNRRPDRVVIFPDHVDIIDYKFGKEEKSYTRQISHYASLYREMGYADVRAYLWYIGEDTRVERIV